MSNWLSLDDSEGKRVPDRFSTVTDAHVHLFPDSVFQAIWRWFDEFAWPIRYKFTSPQIIEFLSARGIDRIMGLLYAHRPEMSRYLNHYMAELCGKYPQVIGVATVFPGESGAITIMEEAFRMGLVGIKLHAHVQCFAMDDSAMHEIYRSCADHNKALIMHVGREPKNPNYPYKRDPYETCDVIKLECVLKKYPDLRICVPHLGADQFGQYQRLLECYDNLWVDTAMALADYLPNLDPPCLSDLRADRVMFGTDFPNIPYAWDREIRRLESLHLPEDFLTGLLDRNTSEFLSIKT
jgi:predicted TIM-barrel fold metal-dependent hydrolase